MLDLANRILKIIESKSELKFMDAMEDDPKVRQPDIALAKRLLGWEPEITPDEGLRRTIEWFQAEKEAGR